MYWRVVVSLLSGLLLCADYAAKLLRCVRDARVTLSRFFSSRSYVLNILTVARDVVVFLTCYHPYVL